MEKNKGFTLVELVIVLSCFSVVMMLFLTILTSSSEDTYTVSEKIEVQSSVTTLMNAIQQDIQEAKIVNISVSERGILIKDTGEYIFNTAFGSDYNKNTVVYTFDKENMTVIRKNGTADNYGTSVYNNIAAFSMTMIKDENYGVEIKITGGKKPIDYEGMDKSRYTLNSTYYTRNTQ